MKELESDNGDAVSASISSVTAPSSASVKLSSASAVRPESVLSSASANVSNTTSNSAKISEASSSVSRRFLPKTNVVALVNRTTRTVENLHCVLVLANELDNLP